MCALGCTPYTAAYPPLARRCKLYTAACPPLPLRCDLFPLALRPSTPSTPLTLRRTLPPPALRRTSLLQCGVPSHPCTAMRSFYPSAGSTPQRTFYSFFGVFYLFPKCRGYAPMYFYLLVIFAVCFFYSSAGGTLQCILLKL